MIFLNNFSKRNKKGISFIANTVKSNRFYLFLIIPFILLGIPASFFMRLPLFFVGLIILINERTINSLYVFLILLIIELLNRYTAKQISSNNEAFGLSNYLNELDSNNIKFQKVSEDKVFSKEQLEFISLYRTDNSHTFGYIFELITPENVVYSQNKGFTIPNIMKNNYKTITYSCAFLRKKHDKLEQIDKFILFHEIGHLIDFASKQRNIKLSSQLSILSIILLFIFNLSLHPFFYLFLVLLVYLFFSKTEKIEDREELFCDIFALKLLELESDFDKKKFIKQTKLVLPIERQDNFAKFIANETMTDLSSIPLLKNNKLDILVTIILTYTLLNAKLSFNFVLLFPLIAVFVVGNLLWLRNNKWFERIRTSILKNCINV